MTSVDDFVRPNSREELTPDLARQLAEIERSANLYENIMSDQHTAAVKADLGASAKPVDPLLPMRPAQHALDAELRRARREAQRVLRLSVLTLTGGVLLAALGWLAHGFDQYLAGLAMLLLAGMMIGLGAVAAYYARQRVEEIDIRHDS